MIIRTTQRAVRRAAFTLMEMLVVVAILVVLAGAAIPIYMSYLDGARLDRAKLDIANLEKTLDNFAIKHGQFPQSWDQLLNPDPTSGMPPVLEVQATMDPWGQQYVLDPSQLHPIRHRPKVYSRGPGGSSPISTW